MFGFLKKDKNSSTEAENKNFLSKALDKTFSSIKTIVPQKKREN